MTVTSVGPDSLLPSRKQQGPTRYTPAMEAVFIGLMALVVLLTGYVSLVVLYNLFKAEN